MNVVLSSAVFSLPLAVLSQYIFAPIIFVLSLFMVLLILVQRGKGGGLTGALGGPGGQSAFGTKAGDLFTRITVVTAGIWIFLLGLSVWWYTETDFKSVLGDTDVVTSPSMGAGATSGMGAGGMGAGQGAEVLGGLTSPTTGTGNTTATGVGNSTSENPAATDLKIPATESTPAKDTPSVTAEIGKDDLPAKTSDSPSTDPSSTEPKADSPPIPAPDK